MEESEEQQLNVEQAVANRYSGAAQAHEPALCCPIDYDARYLEVIPEEVLKRDYGCGDTSRYARPGDVVLDLGSGGGKICFIASQVVGSEGRVIGVDINDEMLSMARLFAPQVAERIGYANVEFRRGRIQDLQLSLDALDGWLAEHPVATSLDLGALDDEQGRLRKEQPLVADDSVDLVVSNCVLNLVRDTDKQQLIQEIFRVLKVGGRIAISDIVSDEVVSESLKADPELWSGCISGAFQETSFLEALETAGFHGITVDKWEAEPWRTVEGIEFRSVTITAQKGKAGPCKEANQAVIYRGPWKRVLDDDGHVLHRGVRTAVCAKTYRILTSAPYGDQIIPIEPRTPIAESDRADFDCARTPTRHPRESKGLDYDLTTDAEACCEPDACC